jgi:ATP-dependent DNA ligase
MRYSAHQVGQGPAFHRHACALGLEGVVSKRPNAGYSPGQCGQSFDSTPSRKRRMFVG